AENLSEIVLDSDAVKPLRDSFQRWLTRIADYAQRAKLIEISHVVDTPVACANHGYLRSMLSSILHLMLAPQRKQNCAVDGKEAWQFGQVTDGCVGGAPYPCCWTGLGCTKLRAPSTPKQSRYATTVIVNIKGHVNNNPT